MREQRLQICGVAVEPGILDLERLTRVTSETSSSVDDVNPGLVPDRHKELTIAQIANLSDVLTSKYLFL